MDAPYVVSLGAVCDPPGTRARIVDESRCNVMPQPRRPARALPSAHSFATSIGTSCSVLVVARELAEHGDAQCTAVLASDGVAGHRIAVTPAGPRLARNAPAQRTRIVLHRTNMRFDHHANDRAAATRYLHERAHQTLIDGF